MARRFLVILIFLLILRPITLVDNPACGQETATSASSGQAVLPPNSIKEIPCHDTVQAADVAESSHHCPCNTLLQPDSGTISPHDGRLYNLLVITTSTVETAVATPPTPPPRLV